jgi:hypothetical protein
MSDLLGYVRVVIEVVSTDEACAALCVRLVDSRDKSCLAMSEVRAVTAGSGLVVPLEGLLRQLERDHPEMVGLIH